jgi:hypothetical protein
MTEIKKGAIMSYPNPAHVSQLGASWLHCWTANPPSYSHVECVPMIHLSAPLPPTVGGNSPFILGFNEPDVTNMIDPDPNTNMNKLIVQWNWMETKAPYRYHLFFSPSVTSQVGDATHLVGQTWLVAFRQRFFDAYGRYPRWAGLGCHIYTSGYAGVKPGQQIAAFKAEVNWYIQKSAEWGCPFGVWINEWAFVPCWTTRAMALANMKLALEWLEQEPGVFRYAWFEASFVGDEPWAFHPHIPTTDPTYATVCNSSLIDWNTQQLTDFGIAYRDRE